MKPVSTVIAALLLLAGADLAQADCAADATVRDVTASFAKGQKAEQSGDAKAALGHYVAAQEYTCDPNPVASQAAERAAAIARPLGDAAVAKGNHESAFDYYERGGLFKAADKALIDWTAARPDDPALYDKARQHFEYRASPAFQENEKARLAVTGAYSLDSSFVTRVRNMPAAGVERALQDEAAAFQDAYLQKRVALVHSRPEDPLDVAGQQQYLARARALAAQFPQDPLGKSRDSLELVQSWASKSANAGEPEAFARRVQERAQIRVTALTQKYAADPQLLEAATDYVSYLPGDSSARDARVVAIKAQAEKLGDAAAGKQQLMLAAEYYGVAGADAKAQRANEQLQALAQSRMQPSMDAARKNAEAMAAQFADPAKRAELQRQAQEMQRQMQESAASKQTPAAKQSQDDLAKQLGM